MKIKQQATRNEANCFNCFAITWEVLALDWIEQGLTSHSTHFRSFRRRCVTEESARIVATVRAHSVCGVE